MKMLIFHLSYQKPKLDVVIKRVPNNLIPRVYSAFKMAACRGEDPGIGCQNPS